MTTTTIVSAVTKAVITTVASRIAITMALIMLRLRTITLGRRVIASETANSGKEADRSILEEAVA